MIQSTNGLARAYFTELVEIRQIRNLDRPVIDQLNDTCLAQLGCLPANGLDCKTKKIGNVLAVQRQIYEHGRRRMGFLRIDTGCYKADETRNVFGRGFTSECQRPSCASQSGG